MQVTSGRKSSAPTVVAAADSNSSHAVADAAAHSFLNLFFPVMSGVTLTFSHAAA
jgi:hypothetical protein